jgi:predicted RNase H-like nuclease (RuvC/YqgF family)
VYNICTLSKEVFAMSSIVYQTNKQTGITYAYESVSYWDKEKKQPRSKRQYLGRVDPETGDIIRKKDKKTDSAEMVVGSVDLPALKKEIENKDKIIADLQKALDDANKKYDELAEKVRTVRLSVAKEFSDV